jgi:hypothetical protein
MVFLAAAHALEHLHADQEADEQVDGDQEEPRRDGAAGAQTEHGRDEDLEDDLQDERDRGLPAILAREDSSDDGAEDFEHGSPCTLC